MLSRRMERLLLRRPGLLGEHLPAYRALVQQQERRNDELRARIAAAEDAERDMHAGSMGPLLRSLPPELAGRVAALAGRSSRAACVALRSSHDAHATLRRTRPNEPSVLQHIGLDGSVAELKDDGSVAELIVSCHSLAQLTVAMPDEGPRIAPLHALDVQRQLRGAAARGKQLRHLDTVWHNECTTIAPLPLALAGLAGLESLRLTISDRSGRGHPGDARELEANLAAALRALGRLTRLELLLLLPAPMAALAPAVASLTLLRSLAVQSNPEPVLQPAHPPPPSLTSLSLVGCSLTAEPAAALAAALGRLPGLLHLVIRNPLWQPWMQPMQPAHQAAVEHAIRGLPGLLSLDIGGFYDDGMGAACIGMLAALTGLQALILTGNALHDLAVPVLARMTGLRDLRLNGCDISGGGALALVEALPAWGSIERLDVRFNDSFLDERLAVALASAASTHRSLKRVDLFDASQTWDDETVQHLKLLAGDRCRLA